MHLIADYVKYAKQFGKMYTSCANCVNIVGVDALLHSANVKLLCTL